MSSNVYIGRSDAQNERLDGAIFVSQLLQLLYKRLQLATGSPFLLSQPECERWD